jgi:AcrR family transcriptional regulator
MPRRPDPELEERILDAAQELWGMGGEHALSMRAVAARAGSHTPLIYTRFKDKEAILRALRLRVVARWRARLTAPAISLRDGLTGYLDFAAERPFEYRLLFGPGFRRRITPGEPALLLDLQAGLARLYGGDPASLRPTALSIWALLHGAAMLQNEVDDVVGFQKELRDACLDACDRIAAGVGVREP